MGMKFRVWCTVFLTVCHFQCLPFLFGDAGMLLRNTWETLSLGLEESVGICILLVCTLHYFQMPQNQLIYLGRAEGVRKWGKFKAFTSLVCNAYSIRNSLHFLRIPQNSKIKSRNGFHCLFTSVLDMPSPDSFLWWKSENIQGIFFFYICMHQMRSVVWNERSIIHYGAIFFTFVSISA